MAKTYDCPICDEPCRPQTEEGVAFLDADAENLLPGNQELCLVRFRCPLGHAFYIQEWDVKNHEEGKE